MRTGRWREVDELLQRALERPQAERERFLRQACPGDPALCAEVQALLDGEDGSVPWLDQAEAAVGSSWDDELRQVGPWRLGAPLGEGGMSLVFEGERADGQFERRVAVKVLKQALLTSDARQRFEREVRALARLEHPGIARLYDAGATEAGLPYLVLERIEGESLNRWAARAGRSLEEKLELFCQICEAVSFAHRSLVVHRDLKPGNVLVTPGGAAKLLDFGIASLLADDTLPGSRLTRTGRQPMTPQYASPEQLRGEVVATTSDVYSLGLILCELLTGRLPYEVAAGSQQELARLLEGGFEIRRPSSLLRQAAGQDLAARRLAQRLRGDLDAIVQTALAEDPQQRYPSAESLGADVRRFLDGLPVTARQPSALYLLSRFVRRHRWGVGVATGIALLVISFTAALGYAVVTVGEERNKARQEAATAQAVVSFLGGLFEGAEPDVQRGRDITARELLDRGAHSLLQDPAPTPTTQASLASAIGKAYFELSLLDEAQPFLERSLEILRSQHPLDAKAISENEVLLARLQLQASRYSSAVDHAREALVTLPGAGFSDQRVEALVTLGQAQTMLGQMDEGAQSLQEALALLEDPARLPEVAATAHQSLGQLRMMQGRPGAHEHLTAALRLFKEVHGDSHPKVLDCRRTLAQIFWDQPDRAAAELEEVLAAQRKIFSGPHEHLIRTLMDLGSLFVTYGQETRALPYLEEALALQKELLGEDHFRVAVLLTGLAKVRLRLGESREAVIPLFRRSLEIVRKHVEATSPNLAFPLMDLGDLLAEMGRPEEGEPLLREALDIMEAHRPRDDSIHLRSRFTYGLCLFRLGRPEEAEPYMREAFELRTPGRALHEENSVERWRASMVDLYQALGRQEEARRFREGG